MGKLLSEEASQGCSEEVHLLDLEVAQQTEKAIAELLKCKVTGILGGDDSVSTVGEVL